MKIRTRLALGIFAIVAVLLIPLLLATRSLERLHTDISTLGDRELERLIVLRRASGALEELSRAQPAASRLQDGAVPTSPGSPSPAPPAEVDTLMLLGIADILESYGFDSAAYHYRDAARLDAEQSDPMPAVVTARRWLNSEERRVAESASLMVESAALQTTRARRIAAGALAVAILLAVMIGAWLTLSIGRPVAALKDGMLDVAEGNFEHPLRIPSMRRDEFGVLAESFVTMTGRLAQLERMKAVWTSVVTHELKTPINVILGNLQLGEAGILGELNPKQQTAFATMRRNANVLKGRVQRLLDFSQFEAGAGKLDLADVDLATLLDGVEESFVVIAQERKVTFDVSRSDELPARVSWDEDRITEVIDNLLSNAFKFTPAGGRVELRTDHAGDAIRIVVRDTGAGIPAEQLPGLFRKFYQADNQKQASTKGTGLGLAISKEIVEAHGGTIGCESTVGVGTTFTVNLPMVASRGGAPAARADAGDGPSGSGRSVV